MKKTPPGKITVVDFVDFECPYCRATHKELAPILAEHAGKVRVARKHVPLRVHRHALDAARAGCCGEIMGKGDEIADALFTAPLSELTVEGCEKIAKEHGLDVERFRACVRDPATDARIKEDGEAFRASQSEGLPTIWIERTKLEGSQDASSLREAMVAALSAL